MKILSFDIGIRNLAFCLYDSDQLKIEVWNVVDILSYGEDEMSYNVLDIAKKWKKDKFVEWFKTNNLELPKNKKEMLEEMKKIVKVENKGNKKEKAGIDLYTKKLLSWLDDNKHLLNCDVVALENQPCLKNPIMKTIQTIIYTYFYYFGVIHGSIASVKLISATNKLKIKPDGFIKKTIKETKKKTGYAERKELAIDYMRFYLENTIKDESLTHYWESHVKKDDLADCYLQAVYVSKTK